LVLETLPTNAQLDFKYDSILYKTLYPSHLREFLNEYPEAVIFDVRSPGEFADTSMFKSLNIGHIKGAINMPIDSIQKSISKITQLRNKPVIVYCSHSSRSRRACKLLSENGFTQIENLNGGMYWMSQAEEANFPGKKDFVVSSLPFTNVSVYEGVKLIRESNQLVILDVRTKEEYKAIDTSEFLNLGHIKNSLNIPFDELKNKLSQLLPYKNDNILVYDHHGVFSNRAAMLLHENGFTKVNNMIGGISAVYEKIKSNIRKEILDNQPAYSLLTAVESYELIQSKMKLVILDLRPVDEYTNAAKETWKNRGKIRNAKNISTDNFLTEISQLNLSKDSNLLLYGNGDQVKYCKYLTENGFKNVNFLFGGIYSLIYTYANIEGYRNVKSVLDNYSGLY